MPRIRDDILDCVIYLYRSVHEADEGINIGGSGFLVSVPCESLGPGDAHVYAITNKHVIDGGAIHLRMNTNDGRKIIMEATKKQWLLSETDDLATIRLAPIPPEVRMLALPQDCLVTPDMVKEHGIGIGDDVLMIGRFITREGKQQNAPTARFGHVSQMMGDPIETDHSIQEEAILCEVRSIGGYSGSPVFLMPNPTYQRPGKPIPTDRGLLLGVDFCHLPNWVNAHDDTGHQNPYIRVPLNSGMAGVIPAWRLQSLLMGEEAVKERQRVEHTEKQRREASASEAGSKTDTSRHA